MNTNWLVKIADINRTPGPDLKKDIELKLNNINQIMSTYVENSEINRLNAFGKKKFRASEDLYRIMKTSEKIYLLTKGAWDPTVGPLVDLWGVGRSVSEKRIPGKTSIDNLLRNTGFKHIRIIKDHYILKDVSDIEIDLASIAKGYAVDEIVKVVKKHGFENFLVEIGGEVFGSGFRKNRLSWRVGINIPQKYKPKTDVYMVVNLSSKAIATSGNYRNFFEAYGKTWSHILNPRTGYPVQNSVVSVSVIADKCVTADGLATGIMVMGLKKGMAMVNELENVECMILVRKENGLISESYSKRFRDYVSSKNSDRAFKKAVYKGT